MIGRKVEKELLNKLYYSDKSQFVAVYGRRRVGKTFLINEVFKDRITFKHSGLSPIENHGKMSLLELQLKHFYNSLLLAGMKKSSCPKDWMDAFLMLEQFLMSIDDGSRQLIFIDEMPWLDTPKSGFITAFEGFWNTWACSRSNLMLIISGSATSWINDKLINNYGGLYNRLTCEIKLSPFTLNECEQFFEEEGIKLSRYDIIQAYMVTGGIPYYLNYFRRDLSLAQNIDELFFKQNAPLKDEFKKLFNSIFSNSSAMISIIKAIGSKNIGLTRKEISKITGFTSGGFLSDCLNALMVSDFIKKYVPFNREKKEIYYKLTDLFCNFYLRFVEENNESEEDFWLSNINSQKISTWRGIAFENVCFNHISKIKKSLGISGVHTKESSWNKSNDEGIGTQIDMIIERADNIVNMCEMKFYNTDFVVDKNYDRVIRNRIELLSKELSNEYAIHPTLITTFGLKYNEYSNDFIKVITIDDLFC